MDSCRKCSSASTSATLLAKEPMADLLARITRIRVDIQVIPAAMAAEPR